MDVPASCIALNGSSRSNGNTKALLNKIAHTLGGALCLWNAYCGFVHS